MCEAETETKCFEPVIPVQAPYVGSAQLFVVSMIIEMMEFVFICQDEAATKQIQYAMAVRYWPIDLYGPVPDDMDEVINDFFDPTGDNFVSVCERPIMVAAVE